METVLLVECILETCSLCDSDICNSFQICELTKMFNKQYLKNSNAIKYNSCCSCLLFLTLTLKFYSIVCNRSSRVILWAENWFLFSSEWQMKKTKQRAVFSLGLEWMKSKRVISSVLLSCYRFISWCGTELLESRIID